MKPAHAPAFPLRRTIAWPIAATLPMLSLVALAQGLPSGGRVTAGQAAIDAGAANALVIRQATPKAVVRWNDFSIGNGRSVTFAQPDAKAATLNIVDGAQASTIAGQLRANGSVLLVNPSGIAITPSGRVDVTGGFVASTLSILDDDFLAGRFLFTGKGGAVSNQGRITVGNGGFVGLLGATVANDGEIRAPLGRVMLGSAQRATLDLTGDGYLQVLLPADVATGDGALVTNSGRIDAEGGTVVLKAATVRTALREAVSMPGEIRARSVSGRDGAIVLDGGTGGGVTVSGRLDASGNGNGTRGGRIDVTGESVALDGATVIATGQDRGGLVRIGGEFQGGRAQDPASDDAKAYVTRFGATPPVASANTTKIDAASRIDVSSPQGQGGTAVVWSERETVMNASLDARGGAGGGAVEISSKSTIQSVDLGKVKVGRGGRLLLDPADIQIDGVGGDTVTDYTFTDNTGGTTTLKESDLVALLEGGTSVTLQASNDIRWANAFSFVTDSTSEKGNLTLEAGRGVTMSGSFTYGNGIFTVTANSANASVVPADRQSGVGYIDMRNLVIANSNGPMVLKLEDGGGVSGRTASGIDLPSFNGNSLSATVSAGAVTGTGSAARIAIGNDVTVANGITLTGNLHVIGDHTLTGSTVNWTTEKTGGLITSEGNTIKFVENGVTTRFGNVSTSDAARVALGNPGLTNVSRAYGDAQPDPASLAVPPIQLQSHSSTSPSLAGVVPTGALSFTGPGVTAAAGSSSVTLGPTGTFSIASGFFADLTTVTVPLTITPRTVTATALNPSYTYGSPAGAVTLNNLVNGDRPLPVTTLAGTPGVAMEVSGADYAFTARTAAGTSAFTVTGLTGTGASNYSLTAGTSGSVAIAQKPLNYSVTSNSLVYGTGAFVSNALTGIVAGDSVQGVGALTKAGPPPTSVALSTRTPVGTYNASVSGLTGTDAANYTLAGSGNTDGTLTITPKTLTWSVANQNVTYGTLAASTSTLNGAVAGDDVTGTVATTQAATPVTLTARTNVGTYSQNVTTLAGVDAGNYTLAGSGNSTGTLVIVPKTLGFTGSSISQVYGATSLPAPALVGVLSGDDVTGTPTVFFNPPVTPGGASGAFGVGNYTVNLNGLTGAQSGNYVLGTGNTPNSVTVTPRTLTYRTANTASTYGTTATIASPVLGSGAGTDSVVAGDVISGVTGLNNGALFPSPFLAAGSYSINTIQLTGGGVSNYAIAGSGNTIGTLTVAPKPLTWQVGNGTAQYGNALPNTASVSGVVNSDNVIPIPNVFENGVVIARPIVGSHPVEVTALQGPGASNYTLATTGNTPGTLLVTPRQITYKVSDATTVYGTGSSAFTVTFANVLPDEADPVPTVGLFAGSTPFTLQARTNVGSYTAKVVGLSDPNYTIANSLSNVNGTFTITPKPIRFTTTGGSTTYGTLASLAPATLNAADIVVGDTIGAGGVVLQSTGAAQAANTAVGSYPLVPGSITGAQAGNYQLTTAGSTLGLLTITPKTLSYSIALNNGRLAVGPTVAYGDLGGSIPTASAQMSGVVAGDNVGVAITNPNVPLSTGGFVAAGTYTWTGGALTGAAAANYVQPAAQSTTLTVTPVPLDLRLFASRGGQHVNTTEYGSTGDLVTSFAPSLRNVRDVVTVGTQFVTPGGAGVAALGERAPIGTYGMRTTGALGGADAGNYTVGFINVDSLQVTPKSLVAQLPGNFSTTYGSTVGTGGAQLQGVLSGESVTPVLAGFLSTGARLDPASSRNNAGLYTVNVGGMTGPDAGNYRIASSNSVAMTINPLAIDVSFDRSSLNQVYGGAPTTPTLVGVLSGDTVTVNMLARPKAATPVFGTATRDLSNLVQPLDIGTYDYFGQLGGASSANYVLPAAPSGTITITPRPLTVVAGSGNTTYGTLGTPQPTLTNVLPNQTIAPNLVLTDSAGNKTTYSDRSNAGNYTYSVNGITGFFAANYTVSNPNFTNAFTIAPRPLTWTGNSSFTAEYGSVVTPGTLSGIVFGDDVGVNVTQGTTTTRATLDASGVMTDSTRRNVGTYAFTVNAGTVGAKAANYAFPTAKTYSVTYEPKSVVYAVDSVTGQYGNYQTCVLANFCQPWVSGIALGKATLQGVLAGDTVNGTVGLIDFKGESGTLTAQTPVGQYFEVVTGLTGAQAGNYRIATSGSLPGILEITPVWVGYKTTSAVYLPSTGVVGVPGIPTLKIAGKDGVLNGDTVTAIVQMQQPGGTPVTDPTKLVAGQTYYFRVVGLQGKDAGNYRVLTTQGHGADYLEPGTLDVFASSTLGLDFAKAVDVPKPPAITPPAPAAQTTAPGSVGIQSDNFGANLPSFGRNITTTGVDFDAAAGPTGARAGGAASGVSQADVNVAGGNLSGQASGYVDALAKVGVTGVQLEANANAHVDVTFKVGAGFVTYGAQADAQGEAQFNRQGAQVSAEARAGTYTSGGASGSIGAAGTGTISATTGAFAYAKADNEYTFKDGKIVAKVDESFGTGVSAGAQGSISGSNGSVSAGATVYSPGVVGGSFDWAAGYKDGTISVNLDLGIKALLGGLELNLGFSINLDEAAKTIANSGFSRAVVSLFGIPADFPHGGPWPDTSLKAAAGMTKDPAARFQYLLDHPEWADWKTDRSYSTTELNNDYYSNKAFYDSYKSLLDGTVALIKAQNDAQKTFMDLLKTNPQAAIDMAHSGTFRDLQNQKKSLQSQAWSLGVHLTVKDGKPVYVNGLI